VVLQGQRAFKYEDGSKTQSLEAALKAGMFPGKEKFLVINAGEISPAERSGSVPEQGYVWRD